MSKDQGSRDPWLSDLAARGDGSEDNGSGKTERAEQAQPRLAAELRLMRALRAIEPPPEEIAAARERVRQRLAAALDDCEPATKHDAWRRGIVLALHVGGRARAAAHTVRHVAEARRPWLVAAALLLMAAGVWGVSQAAAGSLPGSPLYVVKRGQEWMAFQAPLSDTQRSELLGEVARRRLAELRIVAAHGDAAEAHRLTGDLGATVESLIQLTSDMAARHEDTRVVVSVLAQTLAAEDAALSAAQRQDQTLLVRSLASATAHQQQAIQAHNLVVPLPSPTASPANNGNANGKGNGNGNGNSSGNGNGKGNGNANGNGNGKDKGDSSPPDASSPGQHRVPSQSGHRVH